VTGKKTQTLGRVSADDATRYVDHDAPPGATSRYDVTAVRNGPDDEVEQVPATSAASVLVDVPGDRSTAGDGGDGTGSAGGDGHQIDPQLAGQARPNSGGARPNAGGLSSVRIRGVQGRPTPPTTADTGFSETIDYGDAKPAPAPVGDDAVVALFDEDPQGSPWSDKGT